MYSKKLERIDFAVYLKLDTTGSPHCLTTAKTFGRFELCFLGLWQSCAKGDKLVDCSSVYHAAPDSFGSSALMGRTSHIPWQQNSLFDLVVKAVLLQREILSIQAVTGDPGVAAVKLRKTWVNIFGLHTLCTCTSCCATQDTSRSGLMTDLLKEKTA